MFIEQEDILFKGAEHPSGPPIIFNSWGKRSCPEYLLPERGFGTRMRGLPARVVLLRLERPIKTAGINYVIPSPFIRENFSDYYSFALVAFLSPEIVFVPCARICLRLRRLFSVLFPVCGDSPPGASSRRSGKSGLRLEGILVSLITIYPR